MQNFTNNELLLYIFNETSPEKTHQITQTLQQNETMRHDVFQLNNLMDEINSIQFEPSDAVFHSILAHLHSEQEIQIV